VGAGGAVVRVRDRRGRIDAVPVARFDAAALAEAVPWRSRRSGGRGGLSGWYWSSTMTGHVGYGSRLGASRLLFADHDPAVAAMYWRPLSLEPDQDDGNDGGSGWVPEYVLLGADANVTLVELVHDEKQASRAGSDAPRGLAEPCRARGWLLDRWSRPDAVVWANLRFVAGARRRVGIDPELCRGIVAAASAGPVAIRALEQQVATVAVGPRVRAHVLHLLWTGELQLDWTVPLSGTSMIWAAS
jgi:hypothetical protein